LDNAGAVTNSGDSDSKGNRGWQKEDIFEMTLKEELCRVAERPIGKGGGWLGLTGASW
jgi:hypothetical protein